MRALSNGQLSGPDAYGSKFGVATMIDFTIPDLDSIEVVLRPEIRIVKGSEKAPTIPSELLKGRLTLGTPVAVRLTRKTVEAIQKLLHFLPRKKTLASISSI
jgi:hypothetical protein